MNRFLCVHCTHARKWVFSSKNDVRCTHSICIASERREPTTSNIQKWQKKHAEKKNTKIQNVKMLKRNENNKFYPPTFRCFFGRYSSVFCFFFAVAGRFFLPSFFKGKINEYVCKIKVQQKTIYENSLNQQASTSISRVYIVRHLSRILY